MQVRKFFQGNSPLLISMPHIGQYVPADIKSRMTDKGQRAVDTDWHLDLLYDFARDMGASLLMPTHARYVIDLNRPQEDEDLYPGQLKTGLCPVETFDGEKLYLEGEEPDAIEKANRIGAYWEPYHTQIQAELERLRGIFGYAILYDAHSIRASVPRLFDGRLPDLNLGTAREASCAPAMAQAAMDAINGRCSSVLNGRFVGGYITRHYGQPQDHIHAIQMEQVQDTYMDEESFLYMPDKAKNMQPILRDILQALLDWGKDTYGR